MSLLYAILTSVIALGAVPVAWVLALLGRPNLRARLRPPQVADRGSRPRLWIHAASVGEAGIAVSLAREAVQAIPDLSVVISTNTSTGLARIRKETEGGTPVSLDASFLAPLDSPSVTGAFIQRIDPTTVALVETELWPSLIAGLDARRIPIALVNGKLSKRGFRRYMIMRGLMRTVASRINLVCAQSRTFSRRFMHLGVPPERVEVIGNIKFDSLPEPDAYDAVRVRADLGIPPDMPLVVAGSTRPGEEEVILRAARELWKTIPDAGVVLVPRHLQRLGEIEDLCGRMGIHYVKRTSGETLLGSGRQVLVLDTMGELLPAYACGDVAFVGGSLRDFSGHNPLEASALGKPVLFGSYMEQIGSKELLAADAALLVHTAHDMALRLQELLGDSGRHQSMGDAGIAVVHGFKGTLARTLSCMRDRGVL